jgi:hypothetical protein
MKAYKYLVKVDQKSFKAYLLSRAEKFKVKLGIQMASELYEWTYK